MDLPNASLTEAGEPPRSSGAVTLMEVEQDGPEAAGAAGLAPSAAAPSSSKRSRAEDPFNAAEASKRGGTTKSPCEQQQQQHAQEHGTASAPFRPEKRKCPGEASIAALVEHDVSFAVYVPRPHVVWVQELYVSGSQRKQGVGTWLVSEAVGTAAVALQAYRGTPAEQWYKNRALAEPRGRGRVFDAPANSETQVILEAERFHEVPHWR